MACFKPQLPHFVTGDFVPQNIFLNDREYGLALDCLVKGCTDFLILDGETEDSRILLGKRVVEPQPGWWFFGGRMRPGETTEASVQRLMKRELGICKTGAEEWEALRLRLLSVHSYAWQRREQPPVEHGTCDISSVFTLILPREEVEAIDMDKKEYSEFRWFTIDDILKGEDLHPALKQSARDLKSRFLWDKLTRAVEEGDSSDKIAGLATKLVKSQ